MGRLDGVGNIGRFTATAAWFAWRAQVFAEEQEKVATSNSLGLNSEEALRNEQFDLALLLGVRGLLIHDTSSSRRGLIRALSEVRDRYLVPFNPQYVALAGWVDKILFAPSR